MTFIWILITLRDYERCTYVYERRLEVFWAVAAVSENKKLRDRVNYHRIV